MPKTGPFDRYAESYDRWFDENPLAYRSEVAAVRSLLPPGVGVEIGVGTGRFARELGIRYGVEPSAIMRARALAAGIDVVDGVAEALPYPDGSFDFAVMVTTVCFLDDLDASFSEAYRVLRPGGALLVGFIDRESFLGQVYERHKAENVFYREAVFYTVPELVERLRRAGFEELAYAQTVFQPPDQLREPDPVLEGYGRGAFVVIRASSRKARETKP